MRPQPFLQRSINACYPGGGYKETTMAYAPPTPIRAEDPLAYFIALPAPTPTLRPMTALDQMYGYFAAPEAELRRQT